MLKAVVDASNTKEGIRRVLVDVDAAILAGGAGVEAGGDDGESDDDEPDDDELDDDELDDDELDDDGGDGELGAA